MCIPPKTIKVEFSSWPTAAILDLAIAKFVAGWRASTSVMFDVYGPMDSVQVRNSPNTILQRVYRPGPILLVSFMVLIQMKSVPKVSLCPVGIGCKLGPMDL